MSGEIAGINNFGISQDLLTKVIFYSLAGAVCLFAALVVLSRNIFHSVVFLAFTLISIAGIYLYLDAEFLAVVQVLIYMGAIITLFLFAIMLTARIYDESAKQRNQQVFISAIICLAMLSFLIMNIIIEKAWQASGNKSTPLDLKILGVSLMSKYVLPFEVISVILLVALIGAIVIGKAEKVK